MKNKRLIKEKCTIPRIRKHVKTDQKTYTNSETNESNDTGKDKKKNFFHYTTRRVIIARLLERGLNKPMMKNYHLYEEEEKDISKFDLSLYTHAQTRLRSTSRLYNHLQ